MERIVDLSAVEEAALTEMVRQSNTLRLERDPKAQLVDEAEFFNNDVHAELLAKYVTQTAAKTEATTIEKYRAASDQVKAQVAAILATAEPI